MGKLSPGDSGNQNEGKNEENHSINRQKKPQKSSMQLGMFGGRLLREV